MMHDVLYLGSQSASRQQLLTQTGIQFKVLDHGSSECGIENPHDFSAHVLAIASDKLRHLKLPNPESVQTDYIFVLTADTLIRTTKSLQILGKPRDKAHAVQMLELIAQEPIEIMTGCCLERMIKTAEGWSVEKFHYWTSSSLAEFCVDADRFDFYFEKSPIALYACGACVVEGPGQSFLKNFSGSYSGAMGIPLFELVQALKVMDFKL